MPARSDFALKFPREVERRFLRCRASVRAAIRERLDLIASTAATSTKRAKPVARKEPALRFYVYEGYRVVYQIDEQTRRVVVLDVAAVPA